MASGRIAASSPGLNTDTLLYQVPSGKIASISIIVCNTHTEAGQIRISIEDSGATTIAQSNCIEYNTTVDASSVFERGGLVVGSQQKIFCRSSAPNVNFIVLGFEE